MNEQARAEWYQKEKKKRETEGAGKRRTFESAVGIITEEKIRSKERDDMTNWVRFREWAATERMVTGCEPDMLETRWKEEIQMPGNQTMIVNGETLLKQWTGLQDRLGSRHQVNSSVKQRVDLQSTEDLDDFQSQAASRLGRAEDILKADLLVSQANGNRQESVLLKVKEDMLETAKQRRVAEQALFEEAEQLELKRKANATKKVEVSSAALEKLQCENSIAKARETMQSMARKTKAQFGTLKQEVLEVNPDDETIVNELKDKTAHLEELLQNQELYCDKVTQTLCQN